jgi:hypothetical protein
MVYNTLERMDEVKRQTIANDSQRFFTALNEGRCV